MDKQKHLAPSPYYRIFFTALCLICLACVWLTPYKLLFSVLSALSFVPLFWFPIRYNSREKVKELAAKPLSWWTSPFPYLALLAVGLLALAYLY
ncbi:hypothetical protein P2G88_11830 [Aliiglaciecola sp. CAU 1673]|uniref:hypothetical protein n=1 Tax=Aliiglaciecola sp. CAU 1673 TaxID=3032595 RepID=UPI0023D9A7B7|nr:hypothetical protein [Aliiglaciecola sp. CAU 1673]MDF2178940.1 hypothetical protein [Aliiglaciecola sp. CAU 1673]